MEPSIAEYSIVRTVIGAIIWLAVATLLGKWGGKRQIGFWPAFISGLIFPLLSIILILAFGPIKENVSSEGGVAEALEQYQRAKLQNDQAILSQFENATNNMSINDKLEQLKQMKADGLLNEQDYNRMKTNLLIGK